MAGVRQRSKLTPVQLLWHDNGLAHYADGSNGFQYIVFTGMKNTVVKRVPATRRNGKTVVHRQQDVSTAAAGRDLAQQWEDEEAS